MCCIIFVVYICFRFCSLILRFLSQGNIRNPKKEINWFIFLLSFLNRMMISFNQYSWVPIGIMYKSFTCLLIKRLNLIRTYKLCPSKSIPSIMYSILSIIRSISDQSFENIIKIHNRDWKPFSFLLEVSAYSDNNKFSTWQRLYEETL